MEMKLKQKKEKKKNISETNVRLGRSLYCEEGILRKWALWGSKVQMAFLKKKKRPKWSLLLKEEELRCVGCHKYTSKG